MRGLPVVTTNQDTHPVDVSIIVVAWNVKQLLQDCLDSVVAQTKGINYEIIYVDNASEDGSVEMVRQRFPDVRIIENSQNNGFIKANNQGIEIARGRYVLLLNSDTLVLDNAIARTIAFADAHPDAAVVGCRVLNPNRTLQRNCFMYPSLLNTFLGATYLYKIFPGSRFFGRERMTWWAFDDVREVETVCGCFSLVRREAIDQVGMMDPTYFVYGDDPDWCYRFQKAGWSNLYTPDGQIIHLGGQSTAQVSAPMTVQLRLSILRFLRKHRGPVVYWIGCLLMSMFFLVRIPIWLIVWAFVAKNRRRAQAKLQAYVRGVGRVFAPGAPVTRGK